MYIQYIHTYIHITQPLKLCPCLLQYMYILICKISFDIIYCLKKLNCLLTDLFAFPVCRVSGCDQPPSCRSCDLQQGN